MWTRSGVSAADPSSSRPDRKRSGGSSKSKRSSRSEASKSSSRSVNDDDLASSRRSDSRRAYPSSDDDDRPRDRRSDSSKRKQSSPPSVVRDAAKSSRHADRRRGQDRGPGSDDDGGEGADQQQLSHDASLIPNQFPGQAPLEYSVPSIRPGKTSDDPSGGFGLAADYYNDQGESVHRQPGVRPHTPIVTGAEPHLMAALPTANPPEETGQGSAADFYNMDTTAQSEASFQTAPSQGQSSYSTAMGVGAAATGAAALAGAGGSGSSGSPRPPGSQRPSNKPSKPGRQSGSGVPLLAAGAAAAGVAGLGAAAYAHHSHHQGSQQGSQSGQSPLSGTVRPPRPLDGRPAPPIPYAAGTSASYQEQRHEHHGPVSKFVDWWKNYDDVRKMEDYTEYIGVCRYCFDPQSSPRDGPRKHRPQRRPSREFSDRRRVDKESRYAKASSSSSSDSEGGKKGVLAAAGLAGLGLASSNKTRQRRDFDDYAVKAGRRQSQTVLDSNRDRVSYDRRSSESQGVIRSDSSSKRRQSDPRVKDARDSILGGALGAAAGAGIAGVALNSMSQSKRDKKSDYSSSRRRRSNGSVVGAASSSESDTNVGFFGRIFSPRSSKKKSKPQRRTSQGVYQNDSLNSSLVSGLAYGREDPQPRRGKAKREPTARDASNAILGLGTAAALLASADSKRNRNSRQQPDLIAVREARNRPSKPPLTRDSLNRLEQHSEDGWEDASDSARSSSVDTGLAFGDFHRGQNASARRSSGSINSTGSATDKWDWRWGKNKRRPRRSSPSPDPRRASGTILETIVASPPVLADAEAVISRRRDDSFADDETRAPLRYIDPRPLSDFNTPGNTVDVQAAPLRADVRDVPLQQPQPKPAVKTRHYHDEDDYDRFVTEPGTSSRYPRDPYKPKLARVETLPDNYGDSPFPEGYSFPKRRQTDPASSPGSRASPIGPSGVESSRRQSQSSPKTFARDAAITGAALGAVGVAAVALSGSKKRSGRQSSQSVRFAPDEPSKDYRKSSDRRDVREPKVSEDSVKFPIPVDQDQAYAIKNIEPHTDIPETRENDSSGREIQNKDLPSSFPPLPPFEGFPSIPGAFEPPAEENNELVHAVSEPQVEIRHYGQSRGDHEPILDDEIFDPNFFKRARAESEPQSQGRQRTASFVVADLEQRYSSKSPSMAEFFSPPELATPSSALDANVNADNNPTFAEDSMDPSSSTRDFAGIATARMSAARAMSSVPRLNVIAPTPPSSYAGSAKDPHSRSTSPAIPGADEGREMAVEEIPAKVSSPSSRVRWADQALPDPEPVETRNVEPVLSDREIQGDAALPTSAANSPDVVEVRPKKYMPGSFSDEEDEILARTVSPPLADRTVKDPTVETSESNGLNKNQPVLLTKDMEAVSSTRDQPSIDNRETSVPSYPQDPGTDNWNDVPEVEPAPSASASRSSKKAKKSKKRRSQPSAAPWEENGDNDSGRRSRVPEEKVNTSFRSLNTKEPYGPTIDISQESDNATSAISEPQALTNKRDLASQEDSSPDSSLSTESNIQSDRSTDSLLDLERGFENDSLLEERQRSSLEAYTGLESYRDVPEMIRLPDTRPGSPYGSDEQEGGSLPQELDRSPTSPTSVRTPSATAVPLPFFRRTPQSPWSNRDSPIESPSAYDQSPTSAGRRRTSRPSSVDFKSTELMPLYLLERNRKASQPQPEEDLPSLPSSHTTSRASSVLDSDETFESARESQEHSPIISYAPTNDANALERESHDAGYLDSQQATPKAAAVSQGLADVPDLPIDSAVSAPVVAANSKSIEDLNSEPASRQLAHSAANEPLAQSSEQSQRVIEPQQSKSSVAHESAIGAIAGTAVGAGLAMAAGKSASEPSEDSMNRPYLDEIANVKQLPTTDGDERSIPAVDEALLTQDLEQSSFGQQVSVEDEDDSWSSPQPSRGKKGKKNKKSKKGRPTPIQTSSDARRPLSAAPSIPPASTGTADRDGLLLESTDQVRETTSREPDAMEPPLTARKDSVTERDEEPFATSQETTRGEDASADTDDLEKDIMRRAQSEFLDNDDTGEQTGTGPTERAIVDDFERWKASHPGNVPLPSNAGTGARGIEDVSILPHNRESTHFEKIYAGTVEPAGDTNAGARGIEDVSILPHNRESTHFEKLYAGIGEPAGDESSGDEVDLERSQVANEPSASSSRQTVLSDIHRGIVEGEAVEGTAVVNASEDESELPPADLAMLNNIINRRQSESADHRSYVQETNTLETPPEQSMNTQLDEDVLNREISGNETRGMVADSQEARDPLESASMKPESDMPSSNEPENTLDGRTEQGSEDVENFAWVSKSKKKGKKGKKGKQVVETYEPASYRDMPEEPAAGDVESQTPASVPDLDDEWALSSKSKKKKGKNRNSSLPLAALLGASAAEATSDMRGERTADSPTVVGSPQPEPEPLPEDDLMDEAARVAEPAEIVPSSHENILPEADTLTESTAGRPEDAIAGPDSLQAIADTKEDPQRSTEDNVDDINTSVPSLGQDASATRAIETTADDEWAVSTKSKKKKDKKKKKGSRAQEFLDDNPDEEPLTAVSQSSRGLDQIADSEEIPPSESMDADVQDEGELPSTSKSKKGKKKARFAVMPVEEIPDEPPAIENVEDLDSAYTVQERSSTSTVPGAFPDDDPMEIDDERALSGRSSELVLDDDETLSPMADAESRPQLDRISTSDFLEELREEESQSPAPFTSTASYADRDLFEESTAATEKVETTGERSVDSTLDLPTEEAVDASSAVDIQNPATSEQREAAEDEWDLAPKSKKKSKKGKNKAVIELPEPETDEIVTSETVREAEGGDEAKTPKGKKGKKEKKSKKFSLFSVFQSDTPAKKSKSSKRSKDSESGPESSAGQEDNIRELPESDGEPASQPPFVNTEDFMEQEDVLEEGLGEYDANDQQSRPDMSGEGQSANNASNNDDDKDMADVSEERSMPGQYTGSDVESQSQDDVAPLPRPTDLEADDMLEEEKALEEDRPADSQDFSQPTIRGVPSCEVDGGALRNTSEMEVDTFLEDDRAPEEAMPLDEDVSRQPSTSMDYSTRDAPTNDLDEPANEPDNLSAPLGEERRPVSTVEPLQEDPPPKEEYSLVTSSKMSKKEKKKAKKSKKKQWTSIDDLPSVEDNEEGEAQAESSLARTLEAPDEDTGVESGARSMATEQPALTQTSRAVETEAESHDEKRHLPPVTTSQIAAMPTFESTLDRSTRDIDAPVGGRSQSISRLWPSSEAKQIEVMPRSSSESRKALSEDAGFAAALAAGLQASGFDPEFASHRSREDEHTRDAPDAPATEDSQAGTTIEGSDNRGIAQKPTWSFGKLEEHTRDLGDAPDPDNTRETSEIKEITDQGGDTMFDDIVALGLGSAGFDPKTAANSGSSDPKSSTSRSIHAESSGVENDIGAVTMRTPSPKGPAEQWLSSSRRGSPVSMDVEPAGERSEQREVSQDPMETEQEVPYTIATKKSKKKGKKNRKAKQAAEDSWQEESQEAENEAPSSSVKTLDDDGDYAQARSMNRDSGMDMQESSGMKFGSPSEQTVRDSGYHDTMPTTPASRTSEFPHDSENMDTTPTASPTQRFASPVESTSKERTSSLFQSPPNIASTQEPSAHDRAASVEQAYVAQSAEDWDHIGRSEHPNLQPTVEDVEETSPDTYISPSSSARPLSSTAHYRSQSRDLDTIAEQSPERTPLDSEDRHAVEGAGFSPPGPHGSQRDLGVQSNVSGHNRERSDESPSQIHRSIVSPTASDLAKSRRAYARASNNASPAPDLARPSSALSARSRTPGSVVSNNSGSQVLRRSNPSSDLGAEYKRAQAQAPGYPANVNTPRSPTENTGIARPSSYDPLKGSGRASSRDMSDTGVYEGWGDVRESPRSPSRPQSVRKRQSLQIIDLENRLDQAMAENRSLQDGRGLSGSTNRDLPEGVSSAARDEELRQKDLEINSIRASLETLQEEVSRLNQHNEQLTAASRNSSDDTTDRYATVQAEHDDVHQQWQSTSRELEQERDQHNTLKAGMAAAVGAKVSSALAEKNEEIRSLRDELSAATEKIRSLQSQIQESSSSSRGISGGAGSADDFLNVRNEDYIDSACHQLCSHVQQWILRFSKFSDMRACRVSRDIHDDGIESRLDNAVLDGTDVDTYLADRVKRRDIFMSLTMTMIWEYVFTRYLFGMDRTQRQTLKNLEKTLSEVGPQRAVAQWRATTLTLLSRRESYAKQRETDTEAVVQEIFSTLSALLPPPHNLVNQILSSLRNVIRLAVDLSIEMRTQRPEYIMLPPLHPEYDTNGDLVRKVYFNASLMNERSGEFADNNALEVEERSVRIVLFPLVVRKGDESGEGTEEIVVAPAQVLASRTEEEERRSAANARGANSSARSVRGLGSEYANRSQMSVAPSGTS